MSVALPSRGFTSPKRLGRAFFNWDARDLSLIARSGQTLTYTRASIATAVDVAGRIRRLAHAQVPWSWRDADGDGAREVYLLLEGASTNLVKQSEAAATGPWTTIGGTAPTNAAGTYAGLSFCRFGNANLNFTDQAITLTGNGVKGFRFYIKHDGHTGTAFILPVHDTTTSVTKAEVVCTFNSDGTISFLAAVGAILKTTLLADGVYEVIGQSVAVTATDSHVYFANDGSGGGGTCTSFLATGFQVEDGTTPTSYIPTTSTTVTRAASTLSAPFLALPQAMTAYAKVVQLGTDMTGDPYYLDIGNAGANPHFYLFSGGTLGAVAAEYHNSVSAVSTQANTGAVYGDVLEALGTLNPDGSVVAAGRKNGGATLTAAASAALALEATWNGAVINFNRADGGNGIIGLRAAKLGAWGRTMDQMAAL